MFLKAAIETGLTKTDYIFGLDIDEEVVKKWKQINLLKEFGGKEEDLETHFFHQNGLDKIHWEQHTNKYRYKLKQKDINVQQFDVIVGNPPYGGIGIYEEMKMLSESVLSAKKVQRIHTQKLDTLFGEEVEKISKDTTTEHVKLSLSQVKIFELKELSKNLINLEIWKDKKYLPQRINHQLNINGVEINLKDILTLKEIDRLKSYPIEILFIERFIQLAKPGGWIAIIIPDGILTNSNSHYVREFISGKAKVEAIVSLPRDAFKNVGTSAKTSILFLQKYRDQEKKQKDYPVFLASVDSLDEKNFNLVKNNYKNYYNKTMSNKNLVQITTNEKGQEIVMVRVDKTLKEMMEEKPTSIWSVQYWHSEFDEKLKTSYQIKNLGDFVVSFAQGDTPRKHKGEKYIDKKSGGIKFLKAENVTTIGSGLKDMICLGINWENAKYIMPKQHKRLQRTKIKNNSLLIARVGASIGKVIVATNINFEANINHSFDIINFKGLNEFYVAIFFQSVWGKRQLLKNKIGNVAAETINMDKFSLIEIPILPDVVQKNIESEYKTISKYHDKAMEAKKKNNEAEYKKNIDIAEKMLKDLIAKTEAVIRGERKDVI